MYEVRPRQTLSQVSGVRQKVQKTSKVVTGWMSTVEKKVSLHRKKMSVKYFYLAAKCKNHILPIANTAVSATKPS